MRKKSVCIFGAGGLGRSVLSLMRNLGREKEVLAFVEDDACFSDREVMGLPVSPLSGIDLRACEFLLAIGASGARAEVANRLGPSARYASCVHPSSFMLDEVQLGSDAIIFPQTYISRNVRIGAHAVIMTGTGIGHDVQIGDCFTTSGNVCVGGHARIGSRVYCGMSSAIRDGISVVDDVVVGMGAIVIRSIKRSGTYFGNPARRVSGKT